ncbi:MAG: hypothetical protein WC861_07090 [Candidatus Micrarchaeia archaeon]|jgi:hypothetical protein
MPEFIPLLFLPSRKPIAYDGRMNANARCADKTVREFSEKLGIAPPRMKIKDCVHPLISVNNKDIITLSSMLMRVAKEEELREILAIQLCQMQNNSAKKAAPIFIAMQLAEIAGFAASFLLRSAWPAIAGVILKNGVLGYVCERLDHKAEMAAEELAGTLEHLRDLEFSDGIRKAPHATRDALLSLLKAPHNIVAMIFKGLRISKEEKREKARGEALEIFTDFLGDYATGMKEHLDNEHGDQLRDLSKRN